MDTGIGRCSLREKHAGKVMLLSLVSPVNDGNLEKALDAAN